MGKSKAAAHLCYWSINMLVYQTILRKWIEKEPDKLKDKADAAEADANQKKAELAIAKENVE